MEPCAGGGYELALACDEILLVDDRSSAVSLPEVPLLGVLPGTGGLTRVVDKRKVRRDLADMFCTNPDGVKGERAKEWGLVDDIAPPAKFPKLVRTRAEALVGGSRRARGCQGHQAESVATHHRRQRLSLQYVDVTFDRAARTATLTVRAPEGEQPQTLEAIHAAGDQWWPLAMARELDDAILMLRVNELELGLLLLKTAAMLKQCWPSDAVMLRASQRLAGARDHRHVAPHPGAAGRFIAQHVRHHRAGLVLRGTAVRAGAGGRSQLHAGASRRGRRLAEDCARRIQFGLLPEVNGRGRLETRFGGDAKDMAAAIEAKGKLLGPEEALELGLITVAPDDLDWEDEVRIAIEERASLSPDALTGMEASLRFPGAETTRQKYCRCRRGRTGCSSVRIPPASMAR